MQDVFADRFLTLNIHQGIARLDFSRLNQIDPDKKQATYSPSLRLAIPLEAFMQMAEQLYKVREALIQQAGQQQSLADAAPSGQVN